MAKQDDQPEKRVCLGKIANVHGLKGLVKILPYGEDISLLSGKLFTSPTGDQSLDITLKNAQGKYMLAAVKNVTDRNGAEELKGTELWINRDQLPETGEDEYYIDDLIGLEAVDENGTTIGKVISVQNYGAGDLLEIRPSLGGQSFLIPFTDDTFIATADTITIKNYEQFLS